MNHWTDRAIDIGILVSVTTLILLTFYFAGASERVI